MLKFFGFTSAIHFAATMLATAIAACVHVLIFVLADVLGRPLALAVSAAAWMLLVVVFCNARLAERELNEEQK